MTVTKSDAINRQKFHTLNFKVKYNLLFQAKMSGKKLSKVALTISTKGIKVVDMETKEIYVEHSIYRYRSLRQKLHS